MPNLTAYLRARVARPPVEYGLLVSLITVAAIAVLSLFGSQLGDVFSSLVKKL